MKAAHINYSGVDLDYRMASGLAATLADKDPYIIEPVMVAWHDKKAARMSPAIEGANINTRWHDYGESHGGKLEVDVNGEFDFIPLRIPAPSSHMAPARTSACTTRAATSICARSARCATRMTRARKPAWLWTTGPAS